MLSTNAGVPNTSPPSAVNVTWRVCSQSFVFTFVGTASLRHRARQLRETTEHFVDPALLVQAVKHSLLSVVICEMGPFHAWVGRLRGAGP